jgi:hypothetical protein
MASEAYTDKSPISGSFSPISEKDGLAGRSSLDTTSSSSIEELRKEYQDIEAQKQQAAPAEHQISLQKKLLFLAAYFVLNLSLTLSNKALLGKVCFTPFSL